MGGGVGQLLMKSLNENKRNVSSVRGNMCQSWLDSSLRLCCSSQCHACLSPTAKLKQNSRINHIQLCLQV